ncbi:3951_t:CDS:2 [Dentiscutata erythropus]|uniref:3951_t:CDS:1 n=1 Tax=Dentiscutata erythropus TaxID=1348616 RepID=A0A9N9D4G1_9GLOM|nr:3951_t:CDS:2 [Dentiscutata erythropus]
MQLKSSYLLSTITLVLVLAIYSAIAAPVSEPENVLRDDGGNPGSGARLTLFAEIYISEYLSYFTSPFLVKVNISID